jgi:DNA-binding HxlR family transcriptional regulator
MLAAPLAVTLLKEIAGGTKRQSELRRISGYPAETTLRAQVKRLTSIGTIEKRRRNSFPGALEYDLTPSGWDLLFVIWVLEEWLARAPDGPIAVGSAQAKAAIKSLIGAWSTPMLRALAAGPLSLTELDSVISSLNYPSLERRLCVMRMTGQVERRPSDSPGTPYAVTKWLRQGVAAIAAAAFWERRHCPHSTRPLGPREIEAMLLLAAPLIRLEPELSGVCRVAAELPNGDEHRVAGAMLSVQAGRVVSCATTLRNDADASAVGSPLALLEAIVEDDLDEFELDGDREMARALLHCLHSALFKVRIGSFLGIALDADRLIRDDGSN